LTTNFGAYDGHCKCALDRRALTGWTGTCFTVLLTPKKLWNDYGPTLLPPVTEIPANALIVVVEDDVFERMGASSMFLDAGYRVLEAENADDALQILESTADVSLLFTDVSMPGSMSGADLAHQVAERWPVIGIIITSGRPRPEPIPLGAQFYAKPYQPTNVLQHAREMTAPRG
jgi:two-component system, response regulator PdtaR